MSSWAVYTPVSLIYPTRSRPLENLCLLYVCMMRLQITKKIKKLSCVYFPSLEFMESQEMPVHSLISCLNAWLMLDLLALHTTHSGVTCIYSIITCKKPVILLPFPDMIKTSLSLERTYLQALNSLLSSRSPLSLAPLSSSTSQVALMTLKQFKLSDWKYQKKKLSDCKH